MLKIALFALNLVSLHAFGSGSVKVDTLLDTNRSWDGTEIVKWPEGKPEVKVLKYTIPPHTTLAWHKHPVPNVGHVVKGTLIVEVLDGPSKTFGPGDTFEEVVDIWHRGRNEGDTPVEIIVFQAAVKGQSPTIKK